MALSSYTKTPWVNDSAPARNATNLNNQESGIYDVTEETIAQDGRLDALEQAPSELEVTSTVPAVILNVENGGAASTMETTYTNDGGQKHLVSTIQWLAGQNEADWTLSNKDTGVTETMFRIINGGKATIGTALEQSVIQTVDMKLDAKTFNDMTGKEPTSTPGQIYSANGTLNYDTSYGTTLQIGQEEYIEVINETGVTILNGTPVYFTGLSGNKPTVGLADALAFSTARVMGITTMEITNNSSGLVTTFGTVSDINTGGLTSGETIYLANGGGFTNTPPDIACLLGTTLIDDATAGKMLVKVSNFAVFPTVLAYMKGGSAGTTITGTATDVTNYNSGSSGSIFLDYSSAAGTITSPTNGLYDSKINMTLTFDETGNQEEDLSLIVSASISGDVIIPLKIPRNSTGISFSVTDIVTLVANDVVKVQLSGDTQSGVAYPLMNFTLESKDIR